MADQYPDIIARAQDAREHWDAWPAWECYRALEKFPASQEVATLKRQLLVVGFPVVPSEIAAKIFRENLLDFFRVDVELRERLSTRYIFLGYGEKEEERKRLQAALFQNQERLGSYTVSQWLRIFDQRFKLEKRDEKSPLNFLTQSSEVAKMSKVEQGVLREILQTYNDLVAMEVIDEFDIAALWSKVGTPPQRSPEFQRAASKGGNAFQDLPLLEALSKYHQIALQQITREKIKLKTQVEPVRPTLMNWLKYYRSELGIGYHDSVQRGEFLYRSENGRRLSDEERERLSLILRSIEEEFPLPIDTNRSEIVFPETASPVRASRPNQPVRPPAPSAPALSFLPREPKKLRSLEMPTAKPLSFHQGGLPSSYEAKKPDEIFAARQKAPLVSKNQEPASLAFRELPAIQGLKPAPAFSELQRGKPAFSEPEQNKRAWKTDKPQALSSSMSFTSPHVFPAEREGKINWPREREQAPPARPSMNTSATPPLSSSAPVPPPASSELQRGEPAPRRNPNLPRPKISPAPNRFNIVPMSYREKNEKENN